MTCVAPAGDRCGEGALWAATEAAVYWTDVTRFLVHRFEEASASMKSWLFDEPVVALSLTTKPGCLLVALASRLILWWPETDKRAHHGFMLPGYPFVRLNEARADPAGHFWVGSMKNNVLPNGELGEAAKGEGNLYRLAPDQVVSVWRRSIGISNTLCWSPDRKTMYFGDTLENQIWAYDYDAGSAAISNERPFFGGFTRGAPDGSAMDSEGFLWNCRFGGSCIVRVSPIGEVDRIVEAPVTNLTTCTFGGPSLQRLYITSASILSPPGERLAGSLFGLDVDVPGLPENAYRIDA